MSSKLSPQEDAAITEIRLAFNKSIPALLAYVPIGIVFGILFVNAGFSWYLAPLMSALVYGGSVQFLALSMLVAQSSLLTIVITATFIALRNSFYGLSLLQRFNVVWYKKAFLIFTLVDAAYATLISNPPKEGHDDTKFCVWLNLFTYIYWVAGTFIGAVFSKWIPPYDALNFILPSFFMVLVIEYFLAKRAISSIIMPVLAAIVAYLITPQYYLLLAILLSIIAILVLDYLSRKSHG